MTQFVSNHTPTSNTTGWSEGGDGTITATADGLRWSSTGTGKDRYVQVKVYTNPAYSSSAQSLFGSGIQVRKNTAASAGLRIVGYWDTSYNKSRTDLGGYTGYFSDIADTPLTTGLFTTLPEIYGVSFYSDTAESAYLTFVAEDGKPFDYTIKNAKVYDTEQGPLVLDASDAVFTVSQSADSLSATFGFAGGNDEAVSRLTFDFGDGSAATTIAATKTVTHAFPRPGVYAVSLTVDTPSSFIYGSSYRGTPYTSTRQVTAPIGDFTAKFTYQVDFPTLSVDGSSSTAPTRGPVQVYAWNWGDGTTGSGVKATHEYARAGTYTVTLTTSNSTTKASSQTTKSIVIGAAPAAVGSPVYEVGLFFDDPAASVSATNLQAEMVPIIYAQQIQHNWTRNETAAMKFKAPATFLKDALGPSVTVDTLRSDVVLRFNFGAGWVELPMCRFVVDDISADPLNPQTLVDVSCYLAASADCDGLFFTPEMINRAYTADEVKANWSRLFSASNAGAIGRALLPVATTPGSGGPILNYLNVDFSSTADSKGQAWLNTISNLSVPPDANGSGLMDTLVANGAMDWYAQGNVLRWFNPGTCGRRTSTDAIPSLIAGQDIAKAPQTRSLTSQAWGAVVFSGSKAPFVAIDTDATSESYRTASYRGQRYVAMQASSADSTEAALAIAKPTLRQLRRARDGEMQRDLIFYPGMPWAPYRDYWVGDTVTAPGPDGTMITTTVESITLQLTDTGLTASLILGRAFAVDPLASKVASLSGGSGISVGAVGERPPSASTGFIETLVSKKVSNDNGTVNAGTDGVTLEGKGTNGTGNLLISTDGTGPFVRSMTVYNRTYSNAANVYITSSGTVGRSTSASKYKINIADQDYGTAVLDLPIKTWFDKASCENFIGTEDADVSRQVGLIAEDLVDAGLDEFVVHNWETGEVEGIQYDRVALLLIPIVRDLRDQLASTREELDARDRVLESVLARLDALEGPTMNSTAS